MELREAMARASSHFLTKPFPANWVECRHEDMLDFVESKKANIVICKDSRIIYRAIEDLASMFLEVANGTQN